MEYCVVGIPLPASLLPLPPAFCSSQGLRGSGSLLQPLGRKGPQHSRAMLPGEWTPRQVLFMWGKDTVLKMAFWSEVPTEPCICPHLSSIVASCPQDPWSCPLCLGQGQ